MHDEIPPQRTISIPSLKRSCSKSLCPIGTGIPLETKKIEPRREPKRLPLLLISQKRWNAKLVQTTDKCSGALPRNRQRLLFAAGRAPPLLFASGCCTSPGRAEPSRTWFVIVLVAGTDSQACFRKRSWQERETGAAGNPKGYRGWMRFRRKEKNRLATARSRQSRRLIEAYHTGCTEREEHERRGCGICWTLGGWKLELS